MIKILYLFLGILVFTELYSLGVYFVVRKCGEKNPERCFIPFAAFAYTRRVTGVFTVFTIKVGKFTMLMAELSILALLALTYACWGTDNLPDISASSLWQIMILIMSLCALIAWAALISSSRKVFRRFRIRREGLFTLLSALVITVPALYMWAGLKRQPCAMEDLY